MPRVVHFEIHADDPERAGKFYGNVFGWEATRWDGPEPYWLVRTGPDDRPGINGGIMRRRDPRGNVYNTIDVPDVDRYTKKIESEGGKVVVPKMSIPGVGWLAYCTDTEGNIFGIMAPDPGAK
jgi:hypothetical protein